MIRVVEVGPRDGLQNETATVPCAAKVNFINALSETGVSEIEVSAFVSAGMVPQLSDAGPVFHKIRRSDDVVYSALVPNTKGLDRALEAGVEKISVFTAASETFNRKNINTSIQGSLQRFLPVVKRAKEAGLLTRGYVSTAFWCAFEGRIAPPGVVRLTQQLLEMGVDEVAVSDTIGRATPDEVAELLDLLLKTTPAGQLAVHFHDTCKNGVANILKSLSYGINTVDASAGGLGGCPFAPGAAGNVATEDVVLALERAGRPTGVNVDQLIRAREILDPYLKEERRSMPAAASQACSVCGHFNDRTCRGPEAVRA